MAESPEHQEKKELKGQDKVVPWRHRAWEDKLDLTLFLESDDVQSMSHNDNPRGPWSRNKGATILLRVPSPASVGGRK